MKRVQVLSILCMMGLVSCAGPGIEHEIDQVLREYRTEASEMSKASQWDTRPDSESRIPSNFRPWWHQKLDQGIIDKGKRQKETLEGLYVRALKYSNQIRVFSDLPLIRETGVQEASGEFDTISFIEGKFKRTNEATGNILDTGGPPRLKEQDTRLKAGLKKKFLTGTEVELSQEINRTQSNSTFFVPNPQGGAELRLSFVQPLLKGAGIAYNESVINIAKLDTQIARNEFIRQAESHLLEITRAYWNLYLSRAVYFQKKNLVKETKKVVEELQARLDLDVNRSLMARARAALAERRSDLIRSELSIQNAQDRIEALVNDPKLYAATDGELIPTNIPLSRPVPVDLMQAAYIALDNRPEITQSFLQLKAAAIREERAQNEVLPKLNLILEGSLDGIRSEGNVTGAVDRQTRIGGPGYMAGFEFEYSLENNAAEARLQRRQLELRQQLSQVKTTIDTVLLELKISVREVNTAFRDAQAKYESMTAAREDLVDFQERRGLDESTNDITVTTTYLDFLLNTQERLSRSEEEFVQALVTYNVAIVNLQRAKGKLLSYNDVEIRRIEPEEGLPSLELVKTQKSNFTETVSSDGGKLIDQSIQSYDEDGKAVQPWSSSTSSLDTEPAPTNPPPSPKIPDPNQAMEEGEKSQEQDESQDHMEASPSSTDKSPPAAPDKPSTEPLPEPPSLPSLSRSPAEQPQASMLSQETPSVVTNSSSGFSTEKAIAWAQEKGKKLLILLFLEKMDSSFFAFFLLGTAVLGLGGGFYFMRKNEP